MVSLLSTRPDFSSLAEVIVLPEAVIEQVLRCCQGVTDSDEQWNYYLRSLALVGVRHWLEAGSTPFTIRINDQRSADLTASLQVNGWRVGVAIVDSLPTEVIHIPQVTLRGDAAIDLWLLVEVQEELGQIQVLQGLESRHVAARATVLNPAGDFVLPLTAFTLPPDRILFFLQHLPAIAAQTVTQHAAFPLGQAVMNAGRWLNNQLDEVAQQFAWTLLEPLAPASELRSPTQELESILQEVRPQSLQVPQRARAAYTEVAVAAVPLRLYALIWSVLEGPTPEWSLLVFLGPMPGEILPAGIRIRIRDADAVLVEETFSARSEAAYLYAQVFGRWDETFDLEILAPQSDEPLTLPAFGFQPEA